MKTLRPMGYLRWIIAILLCGILTSCSLGERVLETRDVGFDHILEVVTPTTLSLKISGQTFLNARRISNIKVIQEKDALVMLVSMSIIKGKTGYLDYTIPIPNSVNEIKFGKKQTIIWKRGTGPVKLTR